MRARIPIVLAVALASGAASGSARQAAPTQSTGIPECDRYAAMVTACLPKMCDQERMLGELELSLHQEFLATAIKLKGRPDAAKQCARQIDEAIKADRHGCHAPNAASTPMRVRVDTIQPTDTSVTVTFSGDGPADGEEVRLIILTSLGEQPIAVYPLGRWKGRLVLDTASASSTGGPQKAPGRLEPRTTYCFIVEWSRADRRDAYRKGIFTTLPKR